MKIDLDEFRNGLAEYDLDDAQKDELLAALWQIIFTFVQIGWGIDSVHLVIPELADFSSPEGDTELNYSIHTIAQNEGSAITEHSLKSESP
jgi:hypothetical protein